MAQAEAIVRYTTGEVAQAGDRVDNDGVPAVVDDVVASAGDMAKWDVKESGLMLITERAGLEFEPCSSIAWPALVFKSRGSGSLKELMRDISRKAQGRGLTPEILKSILNEP